MQILRNFMLQLKIFTFKRKIRVGKRSKKTRTSDPRVSTRTPIENIRTDLRKTQLTNRACKCLLLTTNSVLLALTNEDSKHTFKQSPRDETFLVYSATRVRNHPKSSQIHPPANPFLFPRTMATTAPWFRYHRRK